MGLDIWFKEDICNVLLAADESSSATAEVVAAAGGEVATLRAYREGFRAALSTVALAFGLSPAVVKVSDAEQGQGRFVSTLPAIAEERR